MHHKLALLVLPFVLLSGSGATAQAAETPASDAPLAWTVDDPGLQWGPCPAFLPEGCAIAVLHGDPAQANADIFFKVPAKASIARHWHTSAERMTLVTGELHVTYDGQDPVILKPGSYAYGPAMRPHQAQCQSEQACVLFIAFESAVDAHAGEPPAP